MKKILLLSICFLTLTSTSFASLQDEVMNYENKKAQDINIVHDKHEYIKKGRYIYRVNKNGDLVGFYKTSASGKKITSYDMDGNKIRTYIMSPTGKLRIY